MKGIRGCQIFLFADFGLGGASATMLALIPNYGLIMDGSRDAQTLIGRSEEAWNG